MAKMTARREAPALRIVITSPSLDAAHNVSGISSVVAVIIRNNHTRKYVHFLVGKPDADRRGVRWALLLLLMYARWARVSLFDRHAFIHFNLSLDPLGLIRDTPLILAARALRRRMVIHLHGGQLFGAVPRNAWLRWVVRGVIGGRHPTIVLGAREAGVLKQACRRANIAVLPNCIDLDDARRFAREYRTTEPVTFLYIGRIAPGKGLDLIGDALEILRRRRREVKFVLAGAGPDERHHVARFRDILGSAFEFTGVVSGGSKTALLRRCDAFVLPSLFEGLPVALLECMAFGLVPITTDVGSIGDVVANGDNGILLGERSGTALADAMESLMTDPTARERLGGNAKQFVLTHHDPAGYVARLNEIYQYE